jgi:hypothetical protein
MMVIGVVSGKKLLLVGGGVVCAADIFVFEDSIKVLS